MTDVPLKPIGASEPALLLFLPLGGAGEQLFFRPGQALDTFFANLGQHVIDGCFLLGHFLLFALVQVVFLADPLKYLD